MVTGCGSEKEEEPDVQATSAEPLEGSYVVTRMTEKGKVRKRVPETTILLEFTDGGLTVDAGCNTMFGAVTQDGEVLQIDDLASTQMGCPPGPMKQDAWLAGVLEGTLRLDRGEGLRLVSGDVEIDLEQQVVNNRDLVGTTWRLDSLIEGQGVSSIPGKTTAGIELGEDGQLSVDTGCNTGSASVTTSDTALEIGPLRTTRMACRDKDARAVEAAMLEVLQGTVSFTIEGDALTISTASSGLGFTAG